MSTNTATIEHRVLVQDGAIWFEAQLGARSVRVHLDSAVEAACRTAADKGDPVITDKKMAAILHGVWAMLDGQLAIGFDAPDWWKG